MKLEERIESFAALGDILRKASNGEPGKYTGELVSLMEIQHLTNPWFTPEFVRAAVSAIANELTHENLARWTDAYTELKIPLEPFSVGVIMAGNIPLAGFHDFLSVLITGNRLVAKTSSKDAELIKKISWILGKINPAFEDMIKLKEGILTGFDAVIATGSNNSSRYFEYYFGKYPHVIRKNRNGTAILDGMETSEELRNLGRDIFLYFGLGCRNVSKLYLPSGYDISALASNWTDFSRIIDHNKYANNYDYRKAVFLVNREKFHDSGFVLLKEEQAVASPVAVLHYEFYDSMDCLSNEIALLSDRIQCITGHGFIPYGEAQSPRLWDYADGIDTVEFLLKKNNAGKL